MSRIPFKSGDEQDVLTGARKHYCWTKRAGATSAVKRRYRRRERQAAKIEIRQSR
jgi:hypothetical protein